MQAVASLRPLEQELTVWTIRHFVGNNIRSVVFASATNVDLPVAIDVVDAVLQLVPVSIQTMIQSSLKGSVSDMRKLPANGALLWGAELNSHQFAFVYSTTVSILSLLEQLR